MGCLVVTAEAGFIYDFIRVSMNGGDLWQMY